MSEETLITLAFIVGVTVVLLVFVIMLVRKQNIRRINVQSGEHQVDLSTHSGATTVTSVRQSGEHHSIDVSGSDKKVDNVKQKGQGNRINIQ